MNKIVILCLLLGLLSGCTASQKPPYGNFAEPSVSVDCQEIAADTVAQLANLYPPAKTEFELKQPTPDTFGIALVQKLRDRGYSIVEFVPETGNAGNSGQVSPLPPSNKHAVTTAPLSLNYVFDQFSAPEQIYRVTAMVENQSITRPYAMENGSVVPVGYWMRKE